MRNDSQVPKAIQPHLGTTASTSGKRRFTRLQPASTPGCESTYCTMTSSSGDSRFTRLNSLRAPLGASQTAVNNTLHHWVRTTGCRHKRHWALTWNDNKRHWARTTGCKHEHHWVRATQA